MSDSVAVTRQVEVCMTGNLLFRVREELPEADARFNNSLLEQAHESYPW